MFSPMGYASPQGHMPYSVDNLGQPLIGCSPQYWHMTDRQHSLRSWSQAPSQLGVYLPEYHQVVHNGSPAPHLPGMKVEPDAPHLPGMKMDPDLKQPFQFQAMADWNYPSVPLCSSEYPAFDSSSQTHDSYTHEQTEFQKRSAQYLKQLALQEAEQVLLPKSLYFSQSSTWAEFYRKFLNYARDKHWSSQECKTNMGYVLDGKAAEYFHYINNQEPCLQYYDLLIRMENFMKEHNSQGVVSPVKTFPYHLTNTQNNYTQIHFSAPANISHQSGSDLRLFSSSVEEKCRQKEIYTPYKDPHSLTNSIIESQSIDTDIVSGSYYGCTFNETKESDTSTAFESKPQCQQRQRYVPYRGSNKDEPFERLETSAESGIKQEDQTTCSLSDRMARLEEMFSRITELTDTHLSRQRKSEKHSSEFHNTQTPSSQDFSKFALHDPQVILLHDPLISAPHDPKIIQVHDPHTTALHDQQSSSLHDPQTPMHNPIPTKQEEKSACHENMNLECSSVTKYFRHSIAEKLGIQSLEEYADWIHGLDSQQFVSSTPKENPTQVIPEYEDLFDEEVGENDNGECSLSQLFSEKDQIVSNAPITAVSADLQTTQVVASGSPASHQEVQELSSMPTEIQESNSEEVEFWWDSLDTKQLRPGEDSLASCEEFIDFMHDRLFGTTSLNRETLGTTEKYEAWVDKKYADTFCSASLQESCYKYNSVREKDLTLKKPEIKSPAQQEQNSSICSAELPAASLYGVTPYVAWNPSLDYEENLSRNSKGNPSLDSRKESCMDRSLEDSTICQLPSSATLRIPVMIQGIALKAVVDTAASVTIVSDKVYRQWTVNPPCLKPATLNIAGRDNKIEGQVVGPVTLKLGSKVFPVVVHVAPIHSGYD